MLTQNKFSSLVRCEAKLGKVEANKWSAYAEQVQQLDALWGKTGKKRGYWLKCIRRTSSAIWCVVRQNCEVEAINCIFTQNKFSSLVRCEAKLGKVEANKWNAYAEQVQQLDALWGEIVKKRGYWLKCLRRTSSATCCVVRQKWQK